MRKKITSIKASILKWWLFKLRNPRLKTVNVGGFKFVFRRYWLDILTESDVFSTRIRVDMYPYGYLYQALTQDKVGQLHGYGAMLYQLASLTPQDAALFSDVSKAIDKYYKRMMVKSANTVKVGQAEDNRQQTAAIEAADEALIEDSINYTKMNRKERRKARRAFKTAINEIVSKE